MVLSKDAKVKPAGTMNYSFFNKVNILRAESKVIKHMIDINLIKIATRMIDTEHGSLQAAFDQIGTEVEVAQFVHPQ